MKKEKERKLRLEEVALLVGSSTLTINNWYKFKRLYPDDEYAKLLPDYEQNGGKTSTRYWKESDIYKLLEFKTKIPQGCKGIMGSVTQKYVKKKELKKWQGKKK